MINKLTKLYSSKLSTFIRTNTSWVKPQGYDTNISIFNCVAKKKVPLILKQKGIITWYTCGPTVYDEAHIGHASCYLKIDLIQRILSDYFNFNLIKLMNITDVDDKIIKRSKELNTSLDLLSKSYENEFWDDLAKLKINRPDLILRVSQNIPCIKDFIHNLIEKKLGYVSEDGSVYFKIKDNSNYGKLVNLKANEEVDSDANQNVVDCALWKASKPNEPFWESPWGDGRPGWHVECSALASKIFGSSLDIHAGGMDLKFPHHENEEAQSCAYHNCPQWVNYWIHIGQLNSKSSEKMSKSLKNTISIKSLLKSTKADDFRFACVMSHYRSRMEYSHELLNTASRTLKKYNFFLNNCELYILKNREAISDDASVKYLLLESRENLHQAFCDDFDTPEVINILNKIVKVTNPLLTSSNISVSTVIGLRNFVYQVMNLFNLSESEKLTSEHESGDKEVLDILKAFRQNVREMGLASKDNDILKLCDEVRSKLQNKGIDIRDLNKSNIRLT